MACKRFHSVISKRHKKRNVSAISPWGIYLWNFKTLACTGHKIWHAWFERMDARTDAQPETNMPRQRLQSWGGGREISELHGHFAWRWVRIQHWAFFKIPEPYLRENPLVFPSRSVNCLNSPGRSSLKSNVVPAASARRILSAIAVWNDDWAWLMLFATMFSVIACMLAPKFLRPRFIPWSWDWSRALNEVGLKPIKFHGT